MTENTYVIFTSVFQSSTYNINKLISINTKYNFKNTEMLSFSNNSIRKEKHWNISLIWSIKISKMMK